MRDFKTMAQIALEEALEDEAKNKAQQDQPAENVDLAEQNRKEFDSFSRLLAEIYQQRESACHWKFKDITSRSRFAKVDGGDWLTKTTASVELHDDQDSPALPLIANVTLPGGIKIEDLVIEQKRVSANLTQFKDDPEALSMNALAMVVTAAASAEMRKKGVVIQGDTPEEQAALYAACRLAGLRIRRAPQVDPQLMQKAAQDMTQAWAKVTAGAQGKYSVEAEAAAKKAAEEQAAQQQDEQAPAEGDKAPDETAAETAEETAQQEEESPAAPAEEPQDTTIFTSEPYKASARQGMGLIDESGYGMGEGMRVASENVSLMEDGMYGRAQGAPAPQTVAAADDRNPEALPEDVQEAAAALADKMAEAPQGDTSPISGAETEASPEPLKLNESQRIDVEDDSETDVVAGADDDEITNIFAEDPEDVADDAADDEPVENIFAEDIEDAAIEAPEQAAPSPAHISAAFNESVLPEEIATRLDVLNIDTDLYKKIRQAVVETGDARRDTLRNVFKDEGLKTSQLTAVVETLDQEGITSPQTKPGMSRRVNFETDGTPKPPQVL